MQRKKDNKNKLKASHNLSDEQAIKGLQESEKRFRAVIENSTDAIALINPFGKALYASPVIKRVLGYTPKEFVGINAFKLVYPKHLPHVMKELSKILLKPGSSVTVEVMAKHKKGHWVWVESTGTNMLHDPDIRAIVSNFRDITEHKEMREKMRISEIRYRTMIEQSPLSTQILSPAGKTLMVNKAWEELWGAKLEHLKDYNMLKDKQLIKLGIMSYIKKGFKGEPTHIPAIKYEPNRTIPEVTDVPYRWVSAIIYPVKDEQGNIQEIVLIHQDITEQKDAAEKVRLSEQQLQAMMDESPAVIFVKDIQGRYLLINRQYEMLFSVTRDEIKGKTDYDLFPKETADHVTKNDRKVLRLKTPVEVEEIVPHNGELHTYISIKFPLYNSQGAPYAVCGIATDITERKQLEERKDDFINMASHELKTPVTSLKMYLQVLKNISMQRKDMQFATNFTKMDRQLNKLTKLISDLLNLSRIQQGKFEFRKEKFVLDILVKEIVDVLQSATEKQEILIEGKMNKKVFGDRDRIGQVLTNLITNAIKYSKDTNKIVVRSRTEGKGMVISVQDFGRGIEKKHQEKIFDRFYQVTDPEEKTFPGLGIGLYISSEIVKQHNGRLWVESKKGKGSTFFFYLPTV